jgi:hypothetical protein
MKILIPILMFVGYSAFAASDCAILGQYVIEERGGKSHMMVCSSGMVGGFMPGGYSASDLLPALEKYKNDPAFMSSLKQLGLGDDYAAVKRTIGSTQGLVALNGDAGDAADRKALDYVMQKLNEDNGATKAIAEKKAREAADAADRKKRDSTPVKLSPDQLANIAQQNKALASQITPENCRGNTKDAGLKAYQVQFEDGEKAILMPMAMKKTGDSEYEVTLQQNAKFFGDMYVTTGTATRKLKYAGDKVYWVGADGKEYPVKAFTELKPNEALGFTRDPGPPTPDSCVWAKNFATPPNAPGRQGGGQINSAN